MLYVDAVEDGTLCVADHAAVYISDLSCVRAYISDLSCIHVCTHISRMHAQPHCWPNLQMRKQQLCQPRMEGHRSVGIHNWAAAYRQEEVLRS